jgi:hypothetical protein
MRRPSHPTIVAYLALFAALSGGAYAAHQINGKTIAKRSIAANRLKKHTLTATEVKAGSLLASSFHAGQLPHGPQGPQGPAGATGPSNAFSVSQAAVPAPSCGPTGRSCTSTVVLAGLPPGSYAIFAKVVAEVRGNSPFPDIACTLTAGTEEDESHASLDFAPTASANANRVTIQRNWSIGSPALEAPSCIATSTCRSDPSATPRSPRSGSTA